MEVSDLDNENVREKCSFNLKCWGIAALADGKLDGPCYGSEITEGNVLNCDYIGHLLLKDRGTSKPPPVDFDAKCPDPNDTENFKQLYTRQSSA